MASVPVLVPYQSGVRLHDGDKMNVAQGVLASIMGQAGSQPVNFPIVRSAQDGLVAKAGGGQTGATPLSFDINRLTTVATAGDSVLLPASKPGLSIAVINSGAAAAGVFGTGADTVTGGASIPTGKVAVYFCVTAGAWFGMVGA